VKIRMPFQAGAAGLQHVPGMLVLIALLVAFALLIASRRKLDAGVFRMVGLSILATIASELAFTQYLNVYGPANMLGHLLKIAAFYFIYRAIVLNGSCDRTTCFSTT